jgi:hypothetical protein
VSGRSRVWRPGSAFIGEWIAIAAAVVFLSLLAWFGVAVLAIAVWHTGGAVLGAALVGVAVLAESTWACLRAEDRHCGQARRRSARPRASRRPPPPAEQSQPNVKRRERMFTPG